MMKNNFYLNVKNKIKNTKYGFTKNFLFHLIAPLFIIVLGCILALTLGFNLSLDFKGGTVATVVFEQDLSVSENYNNAKKQLDKVLKDNKIQGLIYQKVNTSYYGDAITVKFERINENVRKALEEDLRQTFYSEVTDENDLKIFVKVDNFENNVDLGVIISTSLAILVIVIGVFIYLASRFGISAGFVSLIISMLDLMVLICFLAILRIEINLSIVGAFVLNAMYSLICSLMLFTKVNDNFKVEKYAKLTNAEIVDISVKDVLVKNTSFAIMLFVSTFIMGIVPNVEVRSVALTGLFGILISYYSSMFITPGLFTRTYIKRHKKAKRNKDKDNKEEVVEVKENEDKSSQDELLKEPEVIVEEETKENK